MAAGGEQIAHVADDRITERGAGVSVIQKGRRCLHRLQQHDDKPAQSLKGLGTRVANMRRRGEFIDDCRMTGLYAQPRDEIGRESDAGHLVISR